MHQKEAICELFKESKIFTKFNNYGVYSTPIVLLSFNNLTLFTTKESKGKDKSSALKGMNQVELSSLTSCSTQSHFQI